MITEKRKAYSFLESFFLSSAKLEILVIALVVQNLQVAEFLVNFSFFSNSYSVNSVVRFVSTISENLSASKILQNFIDIQLIV